MAKKVYTREELEGMELVDLRKAAKITGLTNYLKATPEDLVERIIEFQELEEEEEEEVDEVEDTTDEAAEKEQEEEEEESEEDESTDEEEEEEDEEEEEAPIETPKKAEKPAKKQEEKKVAPAKKAEKAPKKEAKPSKKEAKSTGPSKSDNVRSIVNEYLESGRDFTSGKIMIELEERFNQKIHRSFVSALISSCKEKFEEAAAQTKKK